MLIQICKSKIAHARITEADLHYEGSITVDEKLLQAVGIIPFEKVEVLNVNNGNRFETYAIAGEAGSGKVCLNGPAARQGVIGDTIIILSYGLIEAAQVKNYKTKIVHLDQNNRIRE